MAKFFTNLFAEQKDVILEALQLMGKGMVGIFVALIIIMIFVWVMAILGKKKQKKRKAVVDFEIPQLLIFICLSLHYVFLKVYESYQKDQVRYRLEYRGLMNQ